MHLNFEVAFQKIQVGEINVEVSLLDMATDLMDIVDCIDLDPVHHSLLVNLMLV